MKRALLEDTDAGAKRRQLELMRNAPAWRKLELVFDWNRTLRGVAMADLRRRFPDASEQELRRRLADRLFGPELAARAYGPSPDSGE